MGAFVYVGSGTWGAGEAGRVSVYELDRDAGTLSFVSAHPAGGLASFLAIDPRRRRLFATDEDRGGVLSFSLDPETGSLRELGAIQGTNTPVYLWATSDGRTLLAANYNQGSIDVFPIDPRGKVRPATQNIPTGSETHCVVAGQLGHVLAANKGSGTLSHLRLSDDRLAIGAATSLESPRHISFGPDGRAYVVSEDAALITAYDVGADGSLELLWQKSRVPLGGSAADKGADLQVTPSGRFLYATNRGGSNSIVGYDLRGPRPELIGQVSTRGETPRSLAIDPREQFLIVGNQEGLRNLALFQLEEDGSLTLRSTQALDVSPFFVGIVEL